jgi:nucleoside-diphosphate-sugar epimerase
MRVLLTGGTSFVVGLHIGDSLLARGHEGAVFNREFPRQSPILVREIL